MLNVNWHDNARSHLDSFVPFAVEAIRTVGKSEVTSHDVSEELARSFGLSIPSEVVNAILKRAGRLGIITRLNAGNVALTAKGKQETHPHAHDRARLLREQEALGHALVKFAEERFGHAWAEPDASRALLAYVEDASARLIAADFVAATPDDSFVSTEADRIIVAAFIANAAKQDPAQFEYILNVAKGSFLSTSLFFQNHFDQDRKFRHTTLYLDTGVLLATLGFEGDEKQAASLEWLRLAQDQGARVAVFEPTLREARGVLSHALGQVRIGRAWEGRPGSVAAHFHATSMTPGTISAAIASLEAKLARLRIEIEGMPDPAGKHHLQVDEDRVEAALNEGAYPYANENALHHDSRVLASIRILRNRLAQDRFEECRAVFVTGNYRVVRASRKVRDLDAEPWPVAMHVNDVAVLLWIKVGSSGSDLPTRQLLAMCLSILRPSEATWNAYLDEMRALERSGVLQDVDIQLIAQRNEIDRSSIIESIDESGEVHFRTPQMLLDIARAELEAPVREELQQKDAELARSATDLGEAQAQARLLAAELDALRREGRKKLARSAVLLTLLLLASGAAVLTVTIISLSALTGIGLAIGMIGLGIQVAVALVPMPNTSLAKKLYEWVHAQLARRSTRKKEASDGATAGNTV